MSDTIQSASVTSKPQDSRCRYWCKIIRAGAPLPTPSAVTCANDVPGPYLRHGDEELFAGDFDQATCEQLEAIHKQTHVALEIILATGTFTPGEYVRDDIYTTEWKLVRHADAPEPASMVTIQRDTAIRHLHTLLNSQRSATQSWKDEDAAREWLRSIGSEAP